MIPALTRFAFIVCLAFIAAFIALANWGADWGIASGIFILAIPLVYSYINLARLRKYTLQDSVENMPLPSGFWEEVFFTICTNYEFVAKYFLQNIFV